MITRLWRGTAETHAAADAYEAFLREHVLPELREIDGFRGATVLRRDTADGVDFVVQTRFDSLDDVRLFAGEDVEAAVVEPQARALLARFDEHAVHYETVVDER